MRKWTTSDRTKEAIKVGLAIARLAMVVLFAIVFFAFLLPYSLNLLVGDSAMVVVIGMVIVGGLGLGITVGVCIVNTDVSDL